MMKTGKILLAVLCGVLIAALLLNTFGTGLAGNPLTLLKNCETAPPAAASANGSPYKTYYDGLDNVSKHAYNCILEEIYKMPDRIIVPMLDREQLDSVFQALLFDNPDLFFLGRKCSVESRMFLTFFGVDYTMSISEYKSAKKELEDIAEEVISGLTDVENQWQTELEIHDYIVNNCTYEIKDDDFSYSSVYGALVNKKAACEGYSKAAKYLLDMVGIDCGIVSGMAEADDGSLSPHMWNAVKINGDFYHLDCTWDDPVSNSASNMKTYTYFNLSDTAIGKTHSEFSHDFGCFTDKENYYEKTGTAFNGFSGAEKSRLTDMFAKAVENGDKYVQVCFGTRSAYEKGFNYLVNESGVYQIMKDAGAIGDRKASGIELRYYANESMMMLTFIIDPERKN